METRGCKIHRNKQCECFCWTCQSLVCSYCMQDHESCCHKVYPLRSIPTFKVKVKTKPATGARKAAKEAGEEKPAPDPEKDHEEQKLARSPSSRGRSSSVHAADDSAKAQAPVIKASSDAVICLKCGSPVAPKDIQLKCQHWAHPACLKGYENLFALF